MQTYRFITQTRCGKTDVIVQEANTLYEAKEKFRKHNELKHSPMKLIRVEFKLNGIWFTAQAKNSEDFTVSFIYLNGT